MKNAMRTIKSTAARVGAWLRANPWAIITALVGVFSAYLLYKSKDNKISSLEDALVVSNTTKNVKALNARAAEILKNADEKTAEIQEIDKKLAESKRRVLELHEGGSLEDMNDEEIARLFSDRRL
jgi:peptidoglycan hydrolase CwlO-like protein